MDQFLLFCWFLAVLDHITLLSLVWFIIHLGNLPSQTDSLSCPGFLKNVLARLSGTLCHLNFAILTLDYTRNHVGDLRDKVPAPRTLYSSGGRRLVRVLLVPWGVYYLYVNC